MTRRLAIPRALGAVVIGGALGFGCTSNPSSDAGDAIVDVAANDSPTSDVAQNDVTQNDVTQNDVAQVDAPLDCAFTCHNDFFPDGDGGIVRVVIYPNGTTSYDASCDAPPPNPACGV